MATGKTYGNQMTFNVAGTTYEGRQGKLIALKKAGRGSYIVLRRETTNPHDANAIAVVCVLPNGTHMKIGYVPRGFARQLAKVVDAGGKTRVRSYDVVGGGREFRYGCRLSVAY